MLKMKYDDDMSRRDFRHTVPVSTEGWEANLLGGEESESNSAFGVAEFTLPDGLLEATRMPVMHGGHDVMVMPKANVFVNPSILGSWPAGSYAISTTPTQSTTATSFGYFSVGAAPGLTEGLAHKPSTDPYADKGGFITPILNLIERARHKLIPDSGDASERLAASVKDAMTFAAVAPALPVPRVNAADDGELVMEWGDRDQKAIASFNGDGVVAYALLQGNKFVPGKERCEAGTKLIPEDFLGYLQGLAEK